jgi:acyl-homoserine-lactone acylase
MKKLLPIVGLALFLMSCAPHAASDPELADWQHHAQNVTIIRDDWGIPHIHGKTDADAIFGMIYAQAEDDFNRIEMNYLNSMGRLAEAEGENEIYRDLRMKLFVDPEDMKAKYQASPDWLKQLMDAWAGGLNYFLHEHPGFTPRVIHHFEPWMALTYTEGSIGGDIESISLEQLRAFYGKDSQPPSPQAALEDNAPSEPSGSNGFAIAPSNAAAGHALLWINPHTSFFFRAELQVSSDEGLNAYGAVTWGQIFVYQGFNEHAGWMHTSSGADNIDEYLETVSKKDDGLAYRYGNEERPLKAAKITVPYKTSTGMAHKEFTVYRSHHGPVVREAGGKWVSVRLMQDPVHALIQSYSRTKAKNYKEFKEVMELHTNSSNNTVFADAEGNIAYFHSNFIPRRDDKLDWTKPVDGSSPATEWQGVLSVDESPNILNPPNGWLYNTNNWPWSAAGPNSPKRKDYPRYVEEGTENPRGVHAIRMLEKRKDFTPDSVIAAAFDSALPEFDLLIPSLLKAYDRTASSNGLKAKLAEQIEMLRKWDHRWAVSSVPTTLAVFWGEELWQRVTPDARKAGVPEYEYMETRASPSQLLESLAAASDKLVADFGTWKIPWGDVNRFQRLTDDIEHPFDDDAPSIPVGFASARWGSLASFGARSYKGLKKIYGTSGNSFLAIVEFGETVKAKAITAGGESGDVRSPHFNDQAQRYTTGNLRDVYFYPKQLEGHTEREYHPGS